MNTEKAQTNQSKAQNCNHVMHLAGTLQDFVLDEKASLGFVSCQRRVSAGLRTWINWLQSSNFTTLNFYLQYCFSFYTIQATIIDEFCRLGL